MATMVGKQKNIVDLLNSLIELDLDAIEAYEAAIDRLEDEVDKTKLSIFMGDHQRHVRELQPLVTELGGVPAAKPDLKRVLTKGKVVLAGLVGDRMILLAMKTNEDDTNTAYDRAVSHGDLPSHVRSLLVRNREDERRHREYIIRQLEAYEGMKEVAPTSSDARR